MKKTLLTHLFCLFSLFIFGQKNVLNIEIQNIQANVGNVMVAIFDKSKHNTSNYVTQQVLAANSNVVKTSFTLTDGEYSVAVYQDLNKNSIIDKNMVGIPQEPYGFSNNARPKFKAPSFSEAKIFLNKSTNIQIKLEKW